MKSYIVGGAVRDRLLGLPVVDRDHVVVGATVDEMIAAGFRPVGKDFPVFLHPATHEQYALARTERKVAPGYAGFVFHADPTVTLEDDLARRDLTINAMAEDETDATLVDPFDGRRDLDARVFRHVGPAFVEDPVRILRLARFAARFDDFTVADETLSLARRMVEAGEVDALVPERVWQELSRGLLEAHPARMIEVLHASGALDRVLPELGDAASTWPALDRAARDGASLATRFAVLVHATTTLDPGTVTRLCERLATPGAVRDVALLVAREGAALRGLGEKTKDDAPEAAVSLLERADAFRRPERFAEFAAAVSVVDANATWRGVLSTAERTARAVDAGRIARTHAGKRSDIPVLLHAARVEAVAAALAQI